MDKENLKNAVRDVLKERILKLETLIEETRASNNDTKSSMGDKYETGREMLQQEINRLQLQLTELQKQYNVLKGIPLNSTQKVQNGSVVKTNLGIFYISVSIGEILFDGLKIMTVSIEAPIVKSMLGKIQNETFVIGSTIQTLIQIW